MKFQVGRKVYIAKGMAKTLGIPYYDKRQGILLKKIRSVKNGNPSWFVEFKGGFLVIQEEFLDPVMLSEEREILMDMGYEVKL